MSLAQQEEPKLIVICDSCGEKLEYKSIGQKYIEKNILSIKVTL